MKTPCKITSHEWDIINVNLKGRIRVCGKLTCKNDPVYIQSELLIGICSVLVLLEYI